jgi:hypothetical protein
MSPCPEHESQILEYAELAAPVRTSLDVHLATCPDCSQFLSVLNEVDNVLTRALPSRLEMDQAVTARVLHLTDRLPVKPSLWPELLDMVGWASVIVILFVVANVLAPAGFQEAAFLAAFALVIATGCGWFVLQGWREFEKP